MKFLMIATALFATSAHAETNDTYNFYFQKAPGPVTVNQGIAAQPGVSNTVVTPGTVPVAATSVTSVPTEESAKNKRFYVGLGFATAGGPNRTDQYSLYSGKEKEFKSGQLMVKAEFELADLISVTGELHKLQRPGSYKSMYSYADNGFIGGSAGFLPAELQPSDPGTVLDYAAGAAINFVHLPTTTISVIGGVMTVPYVEYETVRTTGGIHFAAVTKGVQHQKTLYAGGRMRLIADNTWGIEASYRQLIGAKQAIAEALLTFAL